MKTFELRPRERWYRRRRRRARISPVGVDIERIYAVVFCARVNLHERHKDFTSGMVRVSHDIIFHVKKKYDLPLEYEIAF